jgi:hypothetical protein
MQVRENQEEEFKELAFWGASAYLLAIPVWGTVKLAMWVVVYLF